MLKIIFFLLLSISFVGSGEAKENIEEITQKPGISKTLPIKYFQTSKFIFSKSERKDDLIQVNIYPINCNINANTESGKLEEIALNIFSVQINRTNETISITPINDVIRGKISQNYAKKNCYLSINSYFLNDSQSELEIDNKEENAIYLKNSDCNIFQISYEIKEKSDDNFLYLNFKFEDNSFNINISYFIGEIIKNSTQKNIDNSTSIYLSSYFLVDNDQSIEVIAEKRKININISNYKTGIIHFKIIEKILYVY